jgi:hypothetical protein
VHCLISNLFLQNDKGHCPLRVVAMWSLGLLSGALPARLRWQGPEQAPNKGQAAMQSEREHTATDVAKDSSRSVESAHDAGSQELTPGGSRRQETCHRQPNVELVAVSQ